MLLVYTRFHKISRYFTVITSQPFVRKFVGISRLNVQNSVAGQYALIKVIVVKTRNNLPTIFVIERRKADTERDDLRAQLTDLGASALLVARH